MTENTEYINFLSRLEKLTDEHRKDSTTKRHQSGNRTARENLDHLIDGVKIGGAEAVLAASIFHFSEFSIKEAKEAMKASGITVRF